MTCLRCRHDERCPDRCAWSQVGHDEGCPVRDTSGTGGTGPLWERARIEREAARMEGRGEGRYYE